MALITYSEYLDFDDAPSPIEHGNQVTQAIATANAYIENQTGRSFEIADNPSPVEQMEILNGNGTSRLYTSDAPITAVSKLEYWDGDSWEEYNSTDYPYSFKPGSNIIYFTERHIFYKGWQNIRATYEYGFTTDYPDDLKWACFLIAKFVVTEADRLNLRTQTDGEQSFGYDHKFPKEATDIIWRYRTTW